MNELILVCSRTLTACTWLGLPIEMFMRSEAGVEVKCNTAFSVRSDDVRSVSRADD